MNPRQSVGGVKMYRRGGVKMYAGWVGLVPVAMGGTPRGWRRPARGRGLWAHGAKRGVIRTVAGVVTGSA